MRIGLISDTHLPSLMKSLDELGPAVGDALRSAAQDARSATEDLVDELRALGRPPTESGDEVEAALDELSSTIDTQTAEMEETAEGVSGLTELPAAISSIRRRNCIWPTVCSRRSNGPAARTL